MQNEAKKALKARATRLAAAITTMFNIPVSRSQALELVAKEENYPDWNAASACYGQQHPTFQTPDEASLGNIGAEDLDSCLNIRRLCDERDLRSVLVMGACRSGKTAGFFIPALFQWSGSALVLDPGYEIYQRTAATRKANGHTVLKFNPTSYDHDAIGWNPLSEIRLYTPHDVSDAMGIMALVCSQVQQDAGNHWGLRAQELLTAVALHLAYCNEDASPGGILQYLSDPRWDCEKQMCAFMYNSAHDRTLKAGWVGADGNPTKTHPAITRIVTTLLDLGYKELSTILSVATSYLWPFTEPVIARATARSDFTVDTLLSADKPVTVYLSFSKSAATQVKLVVQMLLDCIARRALELNRPRQKTMLLLDECPSYGIPATMLSGLGGLSTCGIKCMVSFQSVGQLESIFGTPDMVAQGCDIKIVLRTADYETSAWCGNLLGTESDAALRLAPWEAILTESGTPPNKTLLTPYFLTEDQPPYTPS